jgi:hypothetical protein
MRTAMKWIAPVALVVTLGVVVMGILKRDCVVTIVFFVCAIFCAKETFDQFFHFIPR